MAKQDLRKVLTDNLRILMDLSADKKTGAAVGRRAKETHQTTIWRLLNEPWRKPRLDTLSDLAQTFSLAPWQLLVPVEDRDFHRVLQAWHNASPEHKQIILAAAEFALSQIGKDQAPRGATSDELPPARPGGKDVPAKGRRPRRK